MTTAPSEAGSVAAETTGTGRVQPLLPAALLALSAFWTGTLPGGATFAGAATGAVVLFAFAALRGEGLLDPLRLGRLGRWLLWGLVAAALGSWALSEVSRAGRLGLLMAPAFLLVPGAVARCWAGPEARELGWRAMRWVIGAVAAYALLRAWVPLLHGLVVDLDFGSPRTRLPLGHHSLLGVWLVLLLPLARPPGRILADTRLNAGILWSWIPFVLAFVALVATFSRAASLALVAQLVVVSFLVLRRAGARRTAFYGVLGGALYAAVQFGSLLDTDGSSTSTAARLAYYRGGLEGFLAAPWLGHGPGSTPWTLAEFLSPLPGINDPSEIVGQLHSLPLQVLYEVGLVGGLMVLVVLGWFVVRRLREGVTSVGGAALIGLLGGGVASGACSWLDIGALAWAFAVVAGVALVDAPMRAVSPAERWGGRALILLAAGATVGPLLAVHAYQKAIRAGGAGPDAVRALGRAEALDPAYPLYVARKASLEQRRETALEAAEAAPGIAAFQLSAGAFGSRAALERARDLDPLGAVAPFLLALRSPETPDAAACAARALLAEPVLLASTAWIGREELRSRALAEIPDWPGVDAGWKEELLRQAEALPPVTGSAGGTAQLTYGREGEVGGLSIWAFRRLSWPEPWLLLPVDPEAARAIDLPSAARLTLTRPEAFPKGRCRPLP